MIDTNVILVANEQHANVSPDCIIECIKRLQTMGKNGITVIDDGFRILKEYQNKTRLHPPKGVGDVFLKELLRHVGNPKRVEQIKLTELAEDEFAEFPDKNLLPVFDAPDRKFAAVSHAHPEKPPVWQAADCKWLDWWPALQSNGVRVEFLCPMDACEFYKSKFPDRPLPVLPLPG
ncbi:hypothetical protein [Leeia aquatica]|uniref:hypothetical protein n=1 Tax=Leeia aquatica TaxID=2725557 RepID=UPI00197CFF47|nr:hypothetical protein [Leeia aquatica]